MIEENAPALVLSDIQLPKDQYAHTNAPTEWWWHVGTLKAEDGRTFGFEVNAAMMFGNAFMQMEISDVATQKNYQKVDFIGPTPASWAEYDTAKPWFVKLNAAGSSNHIAMNEVDGNPLHMKVTASFLDVASNTQCALDLDFLQEGAPLLVWGTGCSKNVDPEGTSPITKNNYYYSLTNLKASGTLTIGSETIQVTGLTWMDHEYGAFPHGYKWIFHNVQLENGIHFSNFTASGQVPTLNQPLKSFASILDMDGNTIFVPTTTTPLEPVFRFDKVDYFLNFRVEIDSETVKADLKLHALVEDQVFIGTQPNTNVYEGIGNCIGTINGDDIEGTAWIEQNLAPTPN